MPFGKGRSVIPYPPNSSVIGFFGDSFICRDLRFFLVHLPLLSKGFDSDNQGNTILCVLGFQQ
jgi:hypothetical protein